MSRDECVNADWRTIGFEDGANGQAPGRIGDHRKACASHNVVPDRDAYLSGYQEGNQSYCTSERGQRDAQYGNRSNDLCSVNTDYPAGYQEGLASYCTFDVGYEAGLSGEEYLRVCPQEIEKDFLIGYELGSETYRISQAIIELESQVAHIIGLQTDNDRLIEELQHEAVFNRELKVAERVEILADIDSLKDTNEDLDAEHAALDVEIERLYHARRKLDGIEE